jgi:hypothetical protein
MAPPVRLFASETRDGQFDKKAITALIQNADGHPMTDDQPAGFQPPLLPVAGAVIWF